MYIYVTLLLPLFLFTLDTVETRDVEYAYCESYNQLTCKDENKENCVVRQECGPKGPETHNHCFTLWEFNTNSGKSKVHMKGCFLNNKDCYEKSHCVQRNKDETNQLFFCCCNGDMCNQNVTYERMLKQHNEEQVFINDVKNEKKFATADQHIFSIILAASLFIFVVTIPFFSWCFRHRKDSYDNELSKLEMGVKNYASPSHSECNFEIKGIESVDVSTELMEKKALGRFGGAVWKARRNDETIAVKIFPLRDKESWKTELEVFQLPQMNHENILKFIGSRRCGQDLDAEFWLLMAYQERGSLREYLAANSVTWGEMHKIALSVARGLNHLHSEIAATAEIFGYKPTIAHRDFKSKNVLLTADMRACIADFGLALIFQTPEGTCGKQHGRVGTVRYMAPELLDGAINFTKKSFLAIDMYACGLVLWELASRCVFQEELPVKEYKLPFEKEVGMQPTLEDMIKCVSENKYRPYIPETWKNHKGLSTICDTIEECWDHDAEARISASCVLDRISLLENVV